ncbi:glycine-rich domain-containing protein [Rhizobium sp. A37_96]
MKYNQPYDQASNTDAPYVNGNPSSGVQGSIIPAAAVEYPQREIVNVLTKNGLTPSNGDLTQLVTAMRLQRVNYFVAAGSANALSITLDPVPSSWVDLVGAPLSVYISNSNTDAVTLTATGIGALPITRVDGSALKPRDLAAGSVAKLVVAPGSLQLINPATALIVGPTRVLILTSTTTLTVQPGETRAEVQAWAGGGAGGGGSAVGYGGGGGGGEYRQGLFTGLTTGQTIVATVGAGGVGGAGGGGNGGTTSFGSYLTANGGRGAPYSGTGAGGAGIGGTGGSGGTGIPGMAGEGIFNTGSNSAAIIGLGGASWGCGHSQFVNFIYGSNATGSAGNFPGQGGGGASGAGLAGSGAAGMIIVKFYP